MFISVCLECYDGKDGDIVGVNRIDESEPACYWCGEPMFLVYTSHNHGGNKGDYEHISESLAINPVQTKAHRKLFPDVGVLSDGRLRFTSVRSQSKYLKQTGFVKNTQKIRRKVKRITPIATGS
jgi:hypothetical protein